MYLACQCLPEIQALMEQSLYPLPMASLQTRVTSFKFFYFQELGNTHTFLNIQNRFNCMASISPSWTSKLKHMGFLVLIVDNLSTATHSSKESEPPPGSILQKPRQNHFFSRLILEEKVIE